MGLSRFGSVPRPFFNVSTIPAKSLVGAHLADGTVGGGQVTSRTLLASHLAQNVLTYRESVYGVGQNLALDPTLSNATINAVRKAVTGFDVSNAASTLSRSGIGRYLQTTGVDRAVMFVTNDEVPVTPGQTVTCRFWARCVNSPNGQIVMKLRVQKQDLTFLYPTATAAGEASSNFGWTQFVGTYVVPVDAISIRPYIEPANHTQGNILLSEPFVSLS